MRYLILSDMHGNCDALDAVLRKVRRKRFDAVLVLGDLVGYGGGPNQVVEALRDLPSVHMVRGNHDKVVAEIEDGANFNPAALQAARWTTERLTAANLRLVRELPEGPRQVEEKVVICHGSPLDEDAYVFSDFDAFQIFSADARQVTFFGHTHIPSLFVRRGGGIEVCLLRGSGGLEIEDGAQYLINPGSVGQPRDRDPRAAYMTFDSAKRLVHWHRLEYSVDKAQDRIVKAGLPRVLADRLAVGI
ncbi:MAG TPA: metallophosphoesterase family protein [Thermoanaerobaculia bacterium]|nr:metallophosphoesterase family protein [Thermoanaerobaculia bacterium]